MPFFIDSLVRRGLPLLFVSAVFAGCERKEVRVYIAPKEVPYTAAPERPQNADAQPQRELWRPAITYDLPGGWQDKGPDAANVARFSANGSEIAITALMSMKGNESGLVNMWRQVRGQAPLSDEDAAKTLSDVEIAGDTGKMFEVSDQEAGQNRRFIVAFVHRPEGSLFFKIQGEDAAVTSQKPAFFAFLKGVRIAAGSTPLPPEPPPSAGPDSSPPAPPNLPPGWTPVAPGPMQVAKFSVSDKPGAKAEVAISIFPSDTGGVAANVKRWRGQIGLPEGDDTSAAAAAKPLDGAPEGSVLIELENASRALLGAIIPRDGKWWFYKLTGDSPAVAAARDAFIGFAKATP
jgi:hypothetical protein